MIGPLRYSSLPDKVTVIWINCPLYLVFRFDARIRPACSNELGNRRYTAPHRATDSRCLLITYPRGNDRDIRYSRGVSYRANFPIVLVNPIKFRPQIYPIVFARKKIVASTAKENENTIFSTTRRDPDFETSRLRRRRIPHHPPPDLIYDVCFSTATRMIVNGTLVPVRFIPRPLKYIVHGFCIGRPTIRKIKKRMRVPRRRGGRNFCFFAFSWHRNAVEANYSYDATMVNRI